MNQPRKIIEILRGRYATWTTPSTAGLPRLRVLFALPAALLVLGAILVGFAINGSSSGAYFNSVTVGTDPDLIAGNPQTIRSDEWNTGTSWIISQVQQGMPERNGTFPGGMDAALPYDLPRLDWSVAFRPHLIGYLVLDVDQGTAWRWWSAAFALIAATYVFLVTLLPRRPILAAAISIAFFYSPFFQWWFQSSTFWPVVWTMIAMASLVWAVKSSSRMSRWIWAAVLSYLTVVMAMGIYLPYIIPAVYIVAFFGVGLLITGVRAGASWKRVVGWFLPTIAAAVAAGVLMVVFLLTRASTVDAFLSTVYPGERLTPTGSATPTKLIATIASSFTESLDRGDAFLGINSSEASSFFLIGLFLLPLVGVVVYQTRTRRLPLDWSLIGLAAVALLFIAFSIIPGWDAIAHVLYLDRVPFERLKIGLGIVSIALLGVLVKIWDERGEGVRRWPAIAVTAIFLVTQAVAGAIVVWRQGPSFITQFSPFWWLLAAASALAIYLFARNRPAFGALLLLIATVPPSFLVNPVYIGVYDLRDSAVGQKVIALGEESDGAWVGIGGPVVTATLLESGVAAYNGVQGAPSKLMWDQIDPDDEYEKKWNRIGFVNWMQGPGEPEVTNPGLDAVVVSFDACSSFAQKNVSFVLVDHPIEDPCLVLDQAIDTDTADFRIYSVAPAPAG